MARTRPLPRKAVSRSIFPTPVAKDSEFPESKRDKRHIKHSILLSRLQARSGVKKNSKSRTDGRSRRGKLPSVNVQALADALPSTAAEMAESLDSKSTHVSKSSKLKIMPVSSVSLKPKRGMQKRLLAVEKVERERWNANLAVLVGAGAGSGTKNAAENGKTIVSSIPHEETIRAERWAALRKHIANSMELKS